MSGQLKEIRTRIASVKSTQQITKAMKMVSAAKLRKAQEAILQMRPYADKLSDLLSNMVAGLEGDVEIPQAIERPVEKVLVIVLTSDRGLCGAFNSSINKKALQNIHDNYGDQLKAGNLQVMCLGKKSLEFFRRFKLPVIDDHQEIFQQLSFDNAASIVEKIMEQFKNKEYDRVDILYSKFKNAATQIPVCEQYLPIAKLSGDEEEASNKTDFIFEPDKVGIIQALVPKILKTQFYKYLLDSNASEHGARMTAMDKATENANELLGDLRLYYNRARQAAITTELTEIVSGAAALEG